GPNTSDGSVKRVSKYSKYSPSGILSASLNLMTRSDFAVPGGPHNSSGSCATAATHIRSISGCFDTKNRPSDNRNLLMRSRSCDDSFARSSYVARVARSITSMGWAASATIVGGLFLTIGAESLVRVRYFSARKLPRPAHLLHRRDVPEVKVDAGVFGLLDRGVRQRRFDLRQLLVVDLAPRQIDRLEVRELLLGARERLRGLFVEAARRQIERLGLLHELALRDRGDDVGPHARARKAHVHDLRKARAEQWLQIGDVDVLVD